MRHLWRQQFCLKIWPPLVVGRPGLIGDRGWPITSRTSTQLGLGIGPTDPTDSTVQGLQVQWAHRTQQHWGLVDWVKYTCERFKVDNLLIEANASLPSFQTTAFFQCW
jgi:hypothetical protein